MIADAGPRYTHVAIALHWAIAALILFNLATGLTFGLMPEGWEGALVPIHISSGITVLALTIVRIGWRLTHRPPPMLPGLAAWERWLAHGTHLLLYLAMLGMPLTGWLMISAPRAPKPEAAAVAGQPAPPPPAKRAGPMVWGVIPLPKLPMGDKPGDAPGTAHETYEARHGTGGWILLGLFLLHVAGALKHQWFDGKAELQRMGVGRRRVAE